MKKRPDIDWVAVKFGFVMLALGAATGFMLVVIKRAFGA